MSNGNQLIFTDVFSSRLWAEAVWSATTFGGHPRGEAPPYMGIVFENADAGRAIFQEWINHLGHLDVFEELHISIIEGDLTDQHPGYTVHICADPANVINRALGDGIDLDPNLQSVLLMSKINRVHPAAGSSLLRQFKEEYAKHQEFMLAPVTTRADGRRWVDRKFGIVKTVIHFRNAVDIGDQEIDSLVLRKGLINDLSHELQ